MASGSPAKAEAVEQGDGGGGDATSRAYLELMREALAQHGKAADHLRALEGHSALPWRRRTPKRRCSTA